MSGDARDRGRQLEEKAPSHSKRPWLRSRDTLSRRSAAVQIKIRRFVSTYERYARKGSRITRFDARLDYRIGNADQFFARTSSDNSDFTRTSRLPLLPAGFAYGANFTHARGYVVGKTHTFSTNLLNELRAGYNRYTFTNAPVFSGVPISADLGIVNANRTTALGGGALIGGYNNELEYTGDYGTYAVPENTYQINDAVT